MIPTADSFAKEIDGIPRSILFDQLCPVIVGFHSGCMSIGGKLVCAFPIPA
jgi:hypothetical protein